MEGISVIGIGLLLVGLFWVIASVNRFARLENLIRESWANVDVALKRRHDLIPNLVETVRGYAAHERSVFERVVAARQRALDGGAAEESELARSVSSLLAVAEAYPALKSDRAFAELQEELVNTEDRIAAARRFFNANVRDFNIAIESFPGSLLAGGRAAKEFYEIDSISVRENPAVGFGGKDDLRARLGQPVTTPVVESTVQEST